MPPGKSATPVLSALRPRASRTSASGTRRAVLLAVGGVISALCLWLALRHVSFGDVWTSLREAHWVWLVPSLALTYLTLAVRAVRWRYLFCEPERVSTWESTKALNIGLMFNNILPSRAGEVPRALALARATGLSKVEVGTTVVVERLLDVFSIAVAGVIAWTFLPHVSWIHALVIICAVILVGFVAAAAVTWALRRQARDLAERLLRR
ncbi:MAG: lysylphosphatidylglycerol synthase transmembrane domain-containing protein, partial [Gaiellaceae bacterium]